MLLDTVSVIFNGGHGGAGVSSFGKKVHSGPDGGNGGKGGDVYLKATSDVTLLNQFNQKTIFTADKGNNGRKYRQSGKNGKDMEILVPRGTSVFDETTGDLIFELETVGQKELLCVGGKGGRGNYEFRSAKNTTPKYSQPGLNGQERHVKLVLKLIADFGLIGLPNAGKSSLLNELTNAKAKVGAYSFTTLSPNLGICKGKVIADIPGLIEGASGGKGLGISFLKHIEKVGTLFHCIASDSKDPSKDYDTVRSEMKNYNKELLKKTEIILLTKSDLVDEKTLSKLKKKFSSKSKTVLPVSIHDFESLEKLKQIFE
ncbi:MAG TPA: GTPase ObgE [Candidatus Saccharimonadales bacterium]|nr:GTPase ObgE [Candidatus Saccharimonadales bacterium]